MRNQKTIRTQNFNDQSVKSYLVIFTLAVTLMSFLSEAYAKSIEIVIKREVLHKNSLQGKIFVDGVDFGKTFENFEKRIAPGVYPGKLRFISKKHLVGPFGIIADFGDFLLEVEDVSGAGGKKRTNLLFHAGEKPADSKGCIMLGNLIKNKISGNRHLPENHTLVKLRKYFYGDDLPIMSPPLEATNKQITIIVEGFNPSIVGKYQTWGYNEFNEYYEIYISGNTLVDRYCYYFPPFIANIQDVTGEGKVICPYISDNLEMISDTSFSYTISGTKVTAIKQGKKLKFSTKNSTKVFGGGNELDAVDKFNYAKQKILKKYCREIIDNNYGSIVSCNNEETVNCTLYIWTDDSEEREYCDLIFFPRGN